MSETKAPSEEQIQQRAYELFLARGCEPGRELEDWLEAEKELTYLAELTAIGADLAADEELAPEPQEPVVRKKHAAAAGSSAVVASTT